MPIFKSTTRETFTHFQYRILIFVLFKNLPYVRFDKATRLVTIEKMSQLSVEVGYRSAKIRDGLKELQRLLVIHDLKTSYNKASFYIEKSKIG